MSASDDNYVLAKELFLEIIAYECFGMMRYHYRAFYTDAELVVAKYLADNSHITEDEIVEEQKINMRKKYVG